MNRQEIEYLKFNAEEIKDTLRLTGNIYKARTGETAYSRGFLRSEKYINELIKHFDSLLTKEPSLSHTEGEEEFKVYSLSTYEGKSEWSHWSKGLTMIIKKDGITLELKGEELKELVKSLPRTFGGTY